MKSLKSTIFLYFVLLLLAVQGVFLHIVHDVIRQQEEQQEQFQLAVGMELTNFFSSLPESDSNSARREAELAGAMQVPASKLLAQHWWEFCLLALLTVSLSLAGAFVIAKRISQPVQALVQQARRIANGSYDPDFHVENQGELRELAEEFRRMQEAVRGREQLISQHAYHDDLSGLPNRKRLTQVLARETSRSGGSLSKLSIQRINEINSTLGHDVGDEVIRTTAARLGRLCGPDQLFHLGGSEFVVLHPARHPEQVEGFLYALRLVMEDKFQYQGISLYLELQAGSVLFSNAMPLSGDLLQHAAVALQHAQKMGLPWQLYHPALSSDTMQHLQLINDLKNAIELGQLVLHYQPQLDLARGRVEQAEALVRWRHPEHGMIPPDKFIGIAEQTGLINPLTLWVLDEALRQHKQWAGEGLWLPIAVNISAHNLKDAQFQRRVQQAIQDSGLARGAFSLEMTERAMVTDLDNALDVLGRFRDGGIALSIDDYGTGYSSLAQLRQLPVSELKVDRSFIQKLEQQPDSQIIVSSTIELAHKLGLRVVAEGIEDAAALNWLRRVGCDLGQGYHICRPKPAQELSHWLRHGDWCSRPSAKVHYLR